MNKLITHEDPYHIHKLCGIFCLTNFIGQYYSYFVYNKTYGLTYAIIPHILLPLSSFIFKVLQKRPIENKLNMFIWEELRIHALLFSWRACYGIIYPNYTEIISYTTLILADLTTYKFGTPDISTVRGQNNKVGSRNLTKELATAFFSISQFGATIITMGVFQNKPNMILMFSTLPPIQTSAFGMTLIRKNIINKNMWSLLYIVQLLFVYVLWYCEYKNINILFYSSILYALRRAGISKYLLWSFVLGIHYTFYVKLQSP